MLAGKTLPIEELIPAMITSPATNSMYRKTLPIEEFDIGGT